MCMGTEPPHPDRMRTLWEGSLRDSCVGRYATLLLLCLAAVMRPSVEGGLYFLAFLASATWWACYKELQKGFAIVLRILMVIIFVHIFCIYLFQLQWPQEYLDGNSTYARYFELSPLISVDCDDPRVFIWSDLKWDSYWNPIILLILYFVAGGESTLLFMPQIQKKPGAFSRLENSFSGPLSRQLSQRLSGKRMRRSNTQRHRWQTATRKVRVSYHCSPQWLSERTPLIRSVSPSKRYGSGKKSSVMQDSSGSITVTQDGQEEIQMRHWDKSEDEEQPNWFDKLLFAIESFIQFVIRSSYIATNIIMMTWSITYHSWLTFILLLWANLLWIIPNQRRSMLRSSPFLVFYAWFLLISAYIYSMNLTEDELPSHIKNINLAQIGFQKVTELPCNPLLVKCLYTAMFWITLRQYMQERKEAQRSNTLADMVAPLQVTVTTVQGVAKQEEHQSKLLEQIGKIFKRFLTKFWIWVVAITLFAVAITGKNMTVFRIIYMALFLFFILSFQMSFKVWRKMMFGFWLIVIIYSMIILILVYTYQFDNFPEYWRDYLHVPEDQQNDIGLERYETKRLFIRLVTPTFFVIITVIQLHYFHKNFLDISEPKNVSIIDSRSEEGSSIQGQQFEPVSERTDTDTSTIKYDLTNSGHTPSIKLQKKLKQYSKIIRHAVNLFFLFLEIHISKFVLLAGIFLCIYDPCAIHMVIMLMMVLSFTLGKVFKNFAIHFCSVLVSLMLLIRMLYQIKYVDHTKWNVQCDNFPENVSIYNTTNTAEWLGFRKIDANNTLPRLVKWDIIFILMATLRTTVTVRQQNHRAVRGILLKRVYLMFPNIKRADADKDLKSCIKYLFNFGFYKFGVEICLMATVGVIGIRNDIYAVIYGFCLCFLFAAKRSTLAKIWNAYLVYIAIIIPMQYLMVIGFPPNLCIYIAWDNSPLLRRLQDWAYVVDPVYPLRPERIVCDAILLLLVSRQALVFRIEKRNVGQEYPGGSNESIIHHAEQKGFVNPVPDFITFCCSYLDIFKRGIILGFMWVTLATVFLAGTNRVNIFSIGYLLGSFIFLWQGSDLYLRPIPRILKSWNCLLGYNVAVIMLKAVIQLFGCVFIVEMKTYCCWLVQLLAVGCVRKYSNPDFIKNIHDPTFCNVRREYIGLVWDGVCFGFLIMQRRIFNSYNFFHVIDETKAATILASRGAELIEEIRERRVCEQEDEERQILQKIKAKMDRIKANQKKIQGPSFKAKSHFVDYLYPHARPLYRKHIPDQYKAAIRSGDYYMFDEIDDEELDIVDELKPKEDDEDLEKKEGLSLGKIDPPQVSFSDGKRHDKDKPDKEPQPGSSKEEDDMSEPTKMEEGEQTTFERKLLNMLKFIRIFLNSILISCTRFLNGHSKDYRYVLKVLNKEKKILKEKTEYNVGLRLGASQIWQPAGSYHTLLKGSRDGSLDRIPSMETVNSPDSYRIAITQSRRKASVLTVPEIRILAPSLERGLDSPSERSYEGLPTDYEEYEKTEMSSLDQPPVIRLCLAIWYIILSHSDILCYFMIFLYQIKSATFLSLPLPLMVFLWATLNIPRPAKTFWVTVIAYLVVVVLIKCIFQFDIFHWNDDLEIKSYPFYPPRIIGIERRDGYALWDLGLLLVIFFHRFLLKCLGLWKSNYVPAVLLSDGNYKVVNNELVPADLKDASSEPPEQITSTTEGSKKVGVLQKLIEEEKSEDNEEDEETPLPTLLEKSSEKEKKVLIKDENDTMKPVEENLSSESWKGKSGNSQNTESLPDDDKIVSLRSDEQNICEDYADTVKLATFEYADSIKKYFRLLLDPTSRVAADVYSYMFLCDFFNFFVILIGYSSFGTQQGDEGVSAYLEDNKVPVLFLLMLILQFMLIIIDRGIYLRKCILAKIVFQFLQVLILHIWLFILYPLMTERKFNSVIAPQMYYMVKCFYLLLSAYQIRCGYPSRILGNFLCKGYNYVNMFLFKGFMLVPFLFELRTVMDWMWTDTSMTVFDWIKMEDIFAHIFQLKCSRHVENEYPQPRGEKKKSFVKYIMGTIILIVMIGIIWFPLVFFSLGNAVGEPNVPYDVTVNLRIGQYQSIYQMSAQSNAIFSFKEDHLKTFIRLYARNKGASNFISNYEAADIAAIQLNPNSATVWGISPPDKEQMLEEVKSELPINIQFEYQISHKTTTKEDSGVIRENIIISLEPNTTSRSNLLEMLEGSHSASPVLLKYIMPKFLKVTNRGTSKVLNLFMEANSTELEAKTLRSVTIKLSHSNATVEQPTKEWWELREITTDHNYLDFLSKIPFADDKSLMMYTFNDRIFPSKLNFLTGGGIIGLYASLVLVAGRLLRGFFSEICFKIMFEDLPNVDRILQLCYDIYLVREAREFALEEDLFAKLVFLFRSPETLIKWTRPKEEMGEEDPEENENQ
ncbi:piezo-type mechanosensitive ion channel component [Agrilus planipennis]|uniref:Piezo-type mechanosensitive ion channel component n=1 Tax=Agrilus planipennis TaxID=224129 RepID=A0A7F5R5Q5_AGRPL|nr:piezo-type mechanosensitive ion channel component [Agrilus planipennis]